MTSSICVFHKVHGSGVRLADADTAVERMPESFGHALAFSKSTLQINLWMSFELQHTTQWSGTVRIGVTSLSPDSRQAADLPVHAFPKLNDQTRHWLRPLPESMVTNGCRLTIHISAAGALHCFVDGVHRGALLTDLPIMVPLWLMLEVYGNTVGVRAVPTTETPSEVVARGPDALSAYQRACHSGSMPCYRTRLMLVGQKFAGKTSLKNALLGASHAEVNLTSDSIDLSASCSFNLRMATDTNVDTQWRQGLRRQSSAMPLWGSSSTTHQKPQNSQLDNESLEEEYNYALAENIVQELLSQERCPSAMSGTSSSSSGPSAAAAPAPRRAAASPLKRPDPVAGGRHNALAPLKAAAGSSTSISVVTGNAASRLLQEMPEKVVELVTEILTRRRAVPLFEHTANADAMKSKPSNHRQPQVNLDIWDFAGQAVYYTTHQVFLTYRAVYLIVFDLTKDLDGEVSESSEVVTSSATSTSRLDAIDYWMNLIHVHTAQNQTTRCTDVPEKENEEDQVLTPPIILVGTHKNNVASSSHFQGDVEATCAAQFEKILERAKYRPYGNQLLKRCFAVECCGKRLEGLDDDLLALRRFIEETVRAQSYMGEMIPLKWLRLERRLNELVTQETLLVTLNQISAVAQEEGLYSTEELLPALEFLHDLGSIVFYGPNSVCEPVLRDTLILDPHWLVKVFGAVINPRAIEEDKNGPLFETRLRLLQHAVLEERLLDHYWRAVVQQKCALISLMERFDLIVRKLPNPACTSTFSSLERTFYVPSLLNPWSSSDGKVCDSPNAAIFFFKFAGFLPDGFFQRLLCRAIRWSQEQGGRDPVLFRNRAWFFVDQDHDFGLESETSHELARIKVSIYRVSISDESSQVPPPPSQYIVAKVRNFLETALSELRALWMRRASYKVVVACPCLKSCVEHQQEACLHLQCIHFLSLDECLAARVVVCGHRRLKTDRWREWFPDSGGGEVVENGSGGRGATVIPTHVMATDVWNIEVQKGNFLPQWMKSAAKLLNGGEEGRDWQALAEKMGYNEDRIARFNEDLNPALILLADWVVSNGNTSLTVDMIVACLLDISRKDIADVIDQERDSEEERVAVFLSYQWDSQDDVRILRERLERRGFPCWMDVGQMGGGDLLNARIDRALRACSVVLTCVTPRYVVSPLCSRELALADLLRKPLIPVMLERTPWPPPGPLALVLAQYVYVDMHGVGGHGGSGRHADLEDRYTEVLAQVAKHAQPVLVHQSTIESGSPSSKTNRPESMSLHHNQQTPPYHLFEASQTRSGTPEVLSLAPTGRLADADSQRSLNIVSDSPRVAAVSLRSAAAPAAQPPAHTAGHVTHCRVCNLL